MINDHTKRPDVTLTIINDRLGQDSNYVSQNHEQRISDNRQFVIGHLVAFKNSLKTAK